MPAGDRTGPMGMGPMTGRGPATAPATACPATPTWARGAASGAEGGGPAGAAGAAAGATGTAPPACPAGPAGATPRPGGDRPLRPPARRKWRCCGRRRSGSGGNWRRSASASPTWRRKVKLTCLVDNAVLPYTPFWGEHGLSVLVETPEGRVLFDTGASGTVLLHNMEAAEVDPASIQALALSSRAPGTTPEAWPVPGPASRPACLRSSRRAAGAVLAAGRGDAPVGMPVYRSSGPASGRGDARDRDDDPAGGPPPSGRPAPEPTAAGNPARRLDDRRGDRPDEARRAGVPTTSSAANPAWSPDPYRDDLSLVLETGRGLALLCGCCHAGLLNTLAHVERVFGRPVVAVFGGTHLISADADHLERVRQRLQAMPLRRFSPGHCTGETAFHFLWQALGPEIVRPFPAGAQVDLEALE